ncbi:MAG: hypothetical protein Q9209_007509 [Squamulea sp. 1 TL-2023]
MMASIYKTIHILGLGNLGNLTAYYLAASKSAPVTLLLHRSEQVSQWEEAGQCIDVVTNGRSRIQGKFQYEKTFESINGHAGQIYNLIVATKTYATTEALRPLRARLNADSTILFLQNGMGNSIQCSPSFPNTDVVANNSCIGTVDEVTSSLFATPSERPHYYTGIVSHGVYTKRAFSVVHAGQGYIRVGAARPSDERGSSTTRITRDATPRYLLQCLCKAPGLSTSEESEERILHIQLQKLAINAVINPLTTIFDCLNGQLFDNPQRLILSRLLLSEISPVISRVFASSTGAKPDSEAISSFSIPSLEQIVLDAANQTAQNISSMRQDMLNGRRTEIDYINGYIVEQGAKLGVDCGMNQMLVRLINDKRKIADAEIPEIFSNAKHC